MFPIQKWSCFLSVTIMVVAFHCISIVEVTDPKNAEDPEFDYSENAHERLRSHFALDHQRSVKLAMVEEKIFLTFMAISTKGSHECSNTADNTVDTCSRSLIRYLKEFKKDSNYVGGISGSQRAKIVAENPLLLYRMIRRIIAILKEELMKACQHHSDIFYAIMNILKKADISLPTKTDLDDALLGIIRIHFVYGFNAITQLRLGILQHIHTNVTLNFDDCLELGRKATKMEATVLAYQWLSSANLSLADDHDMDKIETEEALTRLSIAWESLLANTDPRDIKQLHNLLQNQKHQERLEQTGAWHYEDYATCRGESRMSEFQKSKLTCFLGGEEIHPYWRIQPLKIEQLHRDPPVLLFHDFIRNKTMSYIKNVNSGMFERSETVSPSRNHLEYSSDRTSMTTWIFDDESHNPPKEMMNLNRRIELCTGFHVIKEGSSHALHVVNYGSLGGHYDFHDDALENDFLTKTHGDRIATFFMFLNNVPLGGYTAFPLLKIFARPIKGSAILWFNLYRNGRPDKRHTHGGCPVILGSKTGANKWILEHENAFRYKCSLHPTQ